MSLNPGFSQKRNPIATPILKDSILTEYRHSNLFEFPNVNKVPYYQDEKALKEIRQLDRAKNWEAMYPLLRNYVAQFGIQNFYKDTFWIWRLAKLTELIGNFDEARLLYKLVLKHHREDIDIKTIELYYDSLTTNEQDYYVPLEYYYELVDYRKEVDTLRPPRSVLLNMGELVNSDLSDYGPTLNRTNDILIFTSRRNSHYRGIDQVHDEDLFFSRKYGDVWDLAEEITSINTNYNEGSACLSKDGKSIYFSRCNAPDSYGGCDIYVSRLRADSTWSIGQNLGPNLNSVAWDSHPSLSHTEDTLFFASDRLGGFGLSDIYYSIKDSEGNWSRARNAGPIINTRNNEVSPFYHHVYDVLYFSSNGQILNFGEYDIYKSYRQGLQWSEPKNIGPLVNGAGSEYYFTIDADAKDLFYARSPEQSMDNLDLYSFPLPMEAQPQATTKFKGRLTNEETGEPYKGIVSIIDMDNGVEVAPKFLRPDGSFEFDLINNNNYLLIIQGDEFFRLEELFFLDGEMQLIRATPPVSSRMKFESLEFEGGKAEITSEMYNDLDKLADFLLDNPDFYLRIAGHTDSDGREEFNIKLSQERAESIKEYLIYFGKVSENRIEAKGFGSSKPIIKDEQTMEDKSVNRRVEFEIYREE